MVKNYNISFTTKDENEDREAIEKYKKEVSREFITKGN